jgi:hypothetical protein
MWRFVILIVVGCATAGVQPLERRAAYIRDFATVQPADLETRVQRYALTDVIVYGLGPMLATSRPNLARSINTLRARGLRVLAPIANIERLRAIIAFSKETGVRFDGLVTEHEFWNRPDRPVAFAEIEALLVAMRREVFAWGTNGARVGAYIGYPTDAETARLVMLVDFVFANYSVKDPELAYRHIHGGVPLRERFASFIKARVTVWPIFYANGEVDMRSALATRGAAAAEATFRAAHSADPELRDYPIAGFVYFTLESLP